MAVIGGLSGNLGEFLVPSGSLPSSFLILTAQLCKRKEATSNTTLPSLGDLVRTIE